MIKVVRFRPGLIHGYMSSPSQMDDVRAALNDAGVPMFDLDLRRPGGRVPLRDELQPGVRLDGGRGVGRPGSAGDVSALANGSINSFYQWLQQQASSLDANLSFSQDFAIVEGAGITIPIPTGIVGALMTAGAAALFNGIGPRVSLIKFDQSDLPGVYGAGFSSIPVTFSLELYLANFRTDFTGDGLKLAFDVMANITVVFNLAGWVASKVPEFLNKLDESVNGQELHFDLGVITGDIAMRFNPKADPTRDYVFKLSGKIDVPALDIFGALANKSIPSYAGDLEDTILKAEQQYDTLAVDVIGFEMGGLVARWYANFGTGTDVLDFSKPKPANIRKLILVGTPNNGSDLAGVVKPVIKFVIDVAAAALTVATEGAAGPIADILAEAGNAIVDILLGPAIDQMGTHTPFLDQLNGHSDHEGDGTDRLPPNVQVWNIFGDGSLTLSHIHVNLCWPLGDCSVQIPFPKLGDNIVAAYGAHIYGDHPNLTEVGVGGFFTSWHWSLLDAGSDGLKAVMDAIYGNPGAGDPTHLSWTVPLDGARGDPVSSAAPVPIGPAQPSAAAVSNDRIGITLDGATVDGTVKNTGGLPALVRIYGSSSGGLGASTIPSATLLLEVALAPGEQKSIADVLAADGAKLQKSFDTSLKSLAGAFLTKPGGFLYFATDSPDGIEVRSFSLAFKLSGYQEDGTTSIPAEAFTLGPAVDDVALTPCANPATCAQSFAIDGRRGRDRLDDPGELDHRPRADVAARPERRPLRPDRGRRPNAPLPAAAGVQASRYGDQFFFRAEKPLVGTWHLVLSAATSENAGFTTVHAGFTSLLKTPDFAGGQSGQSSTWEETEQYKPLDEVTLRAIAFSGGAVASGVTVSAAVDAPRRTVQSHTLLDDGLHGDGVAGDGFFGAQFFVTQVGHYLWTTTIDFGDHTRSTDGSFGVYALPDLTVLASDITVAPADLQAGGSGVVTALIRNQGLGASHGAGIRFYDGDPAGDGAQDRPRHPRPRRRGDRARERPVDGELRQPHDLGRDHRVRRRPRVGLLEQPRCAHRHDRRHRRSRRRRPRLADGAGGRRPRPRRHGVARRWRARVARLAHVRRRARQPARGRHRPLRLEPDAGRRLRDGGRPHGVARRHRRRREQLARHLRRPRRRRRRHDPSARRGRARRHRRRRAELPPRRRRLERRLRRHELGLGSRRRLRLQLRRDLVERPRPRRPLADRARLRHAADFRVRLVVFDAALNESLASYLTVHVVEGIVAPVTIAGVANGAWYAGAVAPVVYDPPGLATRSRRR